MRRLYPREGVVVRSVGHHVLIRSWTGAVFDSDATATGGGRACCGFLLERMDGDLLAHMRNPRFDGPTAAAEVLGILTDVARGLEAMHGVRSGPIVHRDLHIRNVLLRDGRAKIADFGCGRAITAEAAARAAVGS